MDVNIYQGVALRPDKQVGRVDEHGKIYTVGAGAEEYVGWIDYRSGEIFNPDDELVGWVEEDGAIVSLSDEGDGEEIEVGFVTDNGEVFGYDDDEREIYLGKLENMTDNAQGAAAIFFIFE